MSFHSFIKSVLQNKDFKPENESIKTSANDITQKSVKVIDKNGLEIFEKQFQKRTEREFVLVPIHEINPTIYHDWYDCYEDWPYEYVKDFIGWKIQNINQITNCRECKRCMERNYRNAHPHDIITGFDFHYYFEDL